MWLLSAFPVRMLGVLGDPERPLPRLQARGRRGALLAAPPPRLTRVARTQSLASTPPRPLPSWTPAPPLPRLQTPPLRLNDLLFVRAGLTAK